MNNYSNHFLIAMPHMTDVIFSRGLVYMCDHNEKGAMGLIINKPMMTDKVEDILKQTQLDQADPHPLVYFGGPVRVEQGLFLHDNGYAIDGTVPVSKEISLTVNPGIIDDILYGKGPKKFQFTLGYSGWGAGQLEREIENGDWLVMPAIPGFIFETPDNQKWKNAARHFGIDILDLGGPSGQA
ncbi:MAG: YqgE/AlgH family protein [Fidelibacterota bacterium]